MKRGVCRCGHHRNHHAAKRHSCMIGGPLHCDAYRPSVRQPRKKKTKQQELAERIVRLDRAWQRAYDQLIAATKKMESLRRRKAVAAAWLVRLGKEDRPPVRRFILNKKEE